MKILSLLIVLGIGITWTYYRYTRVYNLSYNAEYLQLTNTGGIRRISLDRVKRIDYTSTSVKILGMSLYQYEISFMNENNSYETVSFYTTPYNPEVADLKDRLN
ncbi:MAG: hypothetical protein WBA16_04360 [Nonlabens sp.]